jgi:hypothetical protein
MAITLKRGYEFFYAATTITIVNGCKTPFWEGPWLEGERQRALHRLIFDISKRKSWKVNQMMMENDWVSRINLGEFATL